MTPPCPRWRGRLSVVCIALLAGLSGLAPPPAPAGAGAATGALDESPPTCERDARYRDLDFWLGPWREIDEAGEARAEGQVVVAERGCILSESWSTSSGETARGLAYFDPSRERWQRTLVSSRGEVRRYEGESSGGVWRFEGEEIDSAGRAARARLTLSPSADGGIAVERSQSHDGGQSWEVLPGRRYERPGATRASASSGADASAGASVRERSRRLEESEIPREAQAKIQMASPMQLDVVLGALELLPPDTAWSTRETAAYACNGVTLSRIAAAPRKRRGRVHLELTFSFAAVSFDRRAELTADLISQGEVVASEALDGIQFGKLISDRDDGDALTRSLVLVLEAERFEALFATPSRPFLRLTLFVSS